MLCELGPGSSYCSSKCIIPVIPLTINLSSWEVRKGLYKERDGGGMLRPNIRKGCKAWAKRGRNSGRVSLF
jgi:hypothetical protein